MLSALLALFQLLMSLVKKTSSQIGSVVTKVKDTAAPIGDAIGIYQTVTGDKSASSLAASMGSSVLGIPEDGEAIGDAMPISAGSTNWLTGLAATTWVGTAAALLTSSDSGKRSTGVVLAVLALIYLATRGGKRNEVS